MRLALVIIPFIIVAAGCKPAHQRQLEAEQARVHTPLPLDPTDRYELGPLWANATHTLRLERDASYALYEGTGENARRIERGRWGQQSYAVLWLEPYTQLRPEPRRVTITRLDGRIALVIPGHQPMFAVERR